MQVTNKVEKRGFFSSNLPLWAGISLFLAIGIRWIWRFRAGQPLDIDEAGYLSFSFLDYHGLTHGGLAGYFSAIEASSVHAPLTAAIAALIYCVTGPNWIFGFGVPLLSGVGAIAATYALGRILGSRGVAGLGALLVGSCPIIINYSRSFHFALPATFVATMALVALLRSNRCRHFGLASLFGLCLGLMPLARTMTLGFVPGVVLGALVYVAIDKEDRKRRFLILGWSLLVAALVTGAWLFPNRNDVIGYLLNYGYGNHAAEYGPSVARFGWDAWRTQAQVFLAYIYLPHAIFALVGALALLCLVAQRLVTQGPGAAISILASQATPLVIFVAEGIVALTSTQNKGSAFMAPLVPAAIILAVYACSKLCSHPYYQRFEVALATIVALVGALPSIDWKLAHIWAVEVPVVGRSIVTDGRGTIHLYEAAGGFQSERLAEPIKKSEGEAWIELSRITALKLAQHGAARTRTAFGFLHYLYNTNTVGLEQWVGQGMWNAFAAIDPMDTTNSLAGDVNWLTHGSAADACLLLTSDGEKGDFHPLANQVTMAEAAKQTGFGTIDGWTMPDGQKVTLWRRNSPELRCADIAGNP